MIDLFCFDDIYCKIIRLYSLLDWFDITEETEIILEKQIANYQVIMENMSVDIQYKFDKLCCNCLDIGFDIKPLQLDINYMNDFIINNMLYKEFYFSTERIIDNLKRILSTLEWIDLLVYLLKNNFDEKN